MLTYRWQYYITHPWEIFNELFRHVKWAYQRVSRGWDDRVLWSLDWYLVEMLPIWIDGLIECGIGTPMHMYEEIKWNHTDEEDRVAREKWKNTLEKMSIGFQSGQQILGWETMDIPDEFNEAMDLFKEYFFHLWT